MTRKSWGAALAAVAALILGAAPGHADPIIVSTTPAADGAAMFVADAEGYYAKRGVEVKVTLTNLMPTIPAAIMSDSIQVGCITTTTFVQAVAGGLDLVAIAGGSIISHSLDNTSLVAGADSGIHAPQDLVGKKIGVPGIGAYFHVIVSYWLEQKGVDPKKVQFVEVPFPLMRDNLASKTVDGVGAVDPVRTLIIDSKVGYVVGSLIPALPEGKSILVYAATRDWANKHRKEVAAIHDALADADQLIASDPKKAVEDFGKYVKMPPPALAATKIGVQQANITADQLTWWVDVLKKQGLLTSTPDLAAAVFK